MGQCCVGGTAKDEKKEEEGEGDGGRRRVGGKREPHGEAAG